MVVLEVCDVGPRWFVCVVDNIEVANHINELIHNQSLAVDFIFVPTKII